MLSIPSAEPAFSDSWLRERHRYEVLSHIYRTTRGDCTVSLSCGSISEETGLPRDEVFHALHDLEFLGYVAYVGSGPRVRMTPRAVAYLLIDAGRRRSVRDRRD